MIGGYIISSPSSMLCEDIDRIVILSNSYEEIVNQIKNEFPMFKGKVEDKNFFYLQEIKVRYKDTRDDEIVRLLQYIDVHGLNIFNYDFVANYMGFEDRIDVRYSPKKEMYYLIHNGKKMYFPKTFSSRKQVAKYYKSVCIEQDEKSPHRYLSPDFNINKGDIVVDVGAAEGIFSLDVVDKSSFLYIIESDSSWISALKETFEPYSHKVKIIQAFLTSYDNGEYKTLDSLIKKRLIL